MKAKRIVSIVIGNKSFLHKIPLLFKMLNASLTGIYKPGIKNLFIFLFLIIYLLSPIDLIPDFLIGLGILDDLAIAFFALTKLFKEVDKYAEWEKQRNRIIAIE